MRIKEIIDKYKIYILIFFVVTLPYHIDSSIIGGFAFLILLIGIILRKNNLKELIDNKMIKVFLFFLFFYYLSQFWSESNKYTVLDLKDAFNNFKYYPFFIIGIYLWGLTKDDIKKVLLYIAISPIVYVILYYLNSLGITSIYSSHYCWPDIVHRYKFLMWDFRANPFIIFGTVYFYIKFLFNFKDKNRQKALIFFSISLVYFISLFIDEYTHSRAMDIAVLFALIYVSFSFVSNRYKSMVIGVFLFILTLTVYSQYSEFKKGYDEFQSFVQDRKFEGSFGYRLGMLNVGYELFQKAPFFGSGISNISSQVKDIKEKENFYFANSHLESFHNENILILVQTGLIGYIAFLMFIFYYYKLEINDIEILLFKNSIIIVFLCLSIADYFITNKTTGTAFAIFISLFLALPKKDMGKNT